MSSDIRLKPDWIDMVNDADTRASWAAEAKAKELTGVEFAYVLDELAYYASLHPPGSNVKFSAADGVWFSDTLIDAETTNKVKDYAAILESAPDRQKDWYPNDRTRVLNLIDPSLYPLVYSRSKLCRQSGTSPQAVLKLEDAGEFPGSIDGWHKALNITEDGESGYYLPIDGQNCRYSSSEFSWLPSEFCVDDNGAVTIESYINNVHPVRHAALYPIIASVFSKFLPLLEHVTKLRSYVTEQVVTDLVHPRQPRVIPDASKYYKSDVPLPDMDDDEYDEELILWSTAILQNLEFGSLLFSTAGVTSIISRLPSLVSFTCKIGGLGASIESTPASDRLSTLRAKHYPLSSNFRKLCVPYTANVLADQVAGAAILIAVLCPNFVHVDISPKLRDEFSREIAWASCNRSFQSYAESLRRLIYMDPDY
ncbi:hypothetical protein GGI17_006322 [Coemansia sp. S146]|nr:hypothetical protein GGI17_006322 [Coemansia sp. S146]